MFKFTVYVIVGFPFHLLILLSRVFVTFVFQERKFLEVQAENLEKAVKKLSDQHREKMAHIERKFLEEKQQLLRGALIL